MSEEFLITEELILEFLDPLTAKSYEWEVEESLPAQTRFQASFVDDKNKKYYISFKRDMSLGKSSRQITLSVQKNKISTFKINIDRGSFLKILGTLVQVYSHYKNQISDGKMTGSYSFVFPDSFAKYMKFVARVTKRLFKTEPKLRLELVGALESEDGKTMLFYTNPASVYPYFGGKFFEDKNIKGAFYETLGGKDVQSDIIPFDSTKSEEKPVSLNGAPEGVEQPLFHPANSNFGGANSKTIQMKQDSGSSAMKKGDYGHIVGLYQNSKAKEILPQYNIPLTDMSKFNGKGIMIVKASSVANKYVAIPVHTSNQNDPKNIFDYLDQDMNKIPEPSQNLPAIEELPNKISDESASKNPNAKDVLVSDSILNDIIKDSFSDIPVGPIKMNFRGGSVLDVVDTVKDISKYFGALDRATAHKMIKEARYRIEDAVQVYVDKVNKVFKGEEAFLKFDLNNDEEYKQYEAIEAYTGSSYEGINNYLRKGEEGFSPSYSDMHKTKVRNFVKSIDQTFAEKGLYLPESLVVYRGASISGDEIKNLDSGNTIGLNGYASVSLKPNIAEGFANVSSTNLAIAGSHAYEKQKGSDSTETLTQVSINSRQGNKILYNINRLDRCLSLMIKEVSGHSSEEEILLNRGTRIKSNMLVKVLDRYEHQEKVTDNDGIWFCRASVTKSKLSEGIKDFRKYVLKEESEEQKFTPLEQVSLIDFVLADLEESMTD